MKQPIDLKMRSLIDAYGVDEVLAALARACNDRGMPGLFRRINKIYEWLKS